jgi:hypothetical protein
MRTYRKHMDGADTSKRRNRINALRESDQRKSEVEENIMMAELMREMELLASGQRFDWPPKGIVLPRSG